MPAAIASVTSFIPYRDGQGARVASGKLVITGLAAGNNTVAHGLPATPRKVIIEPTSNGPFWEYQAADATNLYLGVGAGGGTAANVYVEYGV